MGDAPRPLTLPEVQALERLDLGPVQMAQVPPSRWATYRALVGQGHARMKSWPSAARWVITERGRRYLATWAR